MHPKNNYTVPLAPLPPCIAHLKTLLQSTIKQILLFKFSRQFKTFTANLLSSRAALSNPFATRHMWRMAIKMWRVVLFPNTLKLGYFGLNMRKKQRSFNEFN